MFVETSAKLGHNVKTLFKRIAQALPGMEGTDAAAQASNQSESCSAMIGTEEGVHRYTDKSTVIDVKTSPSSAAQEGCAC